MGICFCLICVNSHHDLNNNGKMSTIKTKATFQILKIFQTFMSSSFNIYKLTLCVCGYVSYSVMSGSLRPHMACHAPLSMGIFQTRILEWIAMLFSRGSSWPGDRTCVFCIKGRFYNYLIVIDSFFFLKECPSNYLSFVLILQ